MNILDAVKQSNRIEREPVTGLPFERHLRAASLCCIAADEGQVLHPRVVHGILFEGWKPENTPGHYREEGVYVIRSRDDQRHDFPPPEDVPAMVRVWWKELINHTSLDVWHFHAWFEAIHPFLDGNGRVGRMVMWNMEVLAGRGITAIEYDRRYQYYDALEDWRLSKGTGLGL